MKHKKIYLERICFLFLCLFILHQTNLLNIHKMMCLFCFDLLTYSQFVCYNHSRKRGVGVYKVVNSSDLTLFYRVKFCFLLDLRRTKNKHKCPCLDYNSSFVSETVLVLFISYYFNVKSNNTITMLSLYHTICKLNIVNFSRTWPLVSH